jgi:hypothetical protein
MMPKMAESLSTGSAVLYGGSSEIRVGAPTGFFLEKGHTFRCVDSVRAANQGLSGLKPQ